MAYSEPYPPDNSALEDRINRIAGAFAATLIGIVLPSHLFYRSTTEWLRINRTAEFGIEAKAMASKPRLQHHYKGPSTRIVDLKFGDAVQTCYEVTDSVWYSVENAPDKTLNLDIKYLPSQDRRSPSILVLKEEEALRGWNKMLAVLSGVFLLLCVPPWLIGLNRWLRRKLSKA